MAAFSTIFKAADDWWKMISNLATLSSGQTNSPLRALFFEDLSVGMTETLSKTFSSADVIMFAELTEDRNPIHLSEHFAAKTPFEHRIVHGLYTASLISAVIGTRLPGPGAVYISQSLHFRAPVKIDATVDATVTVAELIPERHYTKLSCICRVGNQVVLEGDALVKVPSAVRSRQLALEAAAG
jgi:3-hydroxybutyryl-CoA dehydratase